MAKKIETYQCEVCKRIYPTETEANGCEVSHNKPVSILRSFYTQDRRNNDMPESLIVVMSNGAEVKYDRCREVPYE